MASAGSCGLEPATQFTDLGHNHDGPHFRRLIGDNNRNTNLSLRSLNLRLLR
jgi:hypothetical protein